MSREWGVMIQTCQEQDKGLRERIPRESDGIRRGCQEEGMPRRKDEESESRESGVRKRVDKRKGCQEKGFQENEMPREKRC